MPEPSGYRYRLRPPRAAFDLEGMINYVTPGYATSVFVSVEGVQRIRTTAESHRRIAIVEVMGRQSGYISLGTAYGQPDIILYPGSPGEHPQARGARARALRAAEERGDRLRRGDPGRARSRAGGAAADAGSRGQRPPHRRFRGPAPRPVIEHLGDAYFQAFRRAESAQAAVFTRKVGHTQRGGRPILFDRFHGVQLGGKAVDLLLEGQNNSVATLQWSRDKGFYVDGVDGNAFRDRWGVIHARHLHPACYDAERMQPSRLGVDYLLPIFTNAIGHAGRGGPAPADLRLGQPLPSVPLREHGREQADPVHGSARLRAAAPAGGQRDPNR